MKIKPSSSSNVATDAETRVNLTSEIARLQSLLQQASAENQAWSEKYGKLETEHASLRETFAGIQQRLAWFEKQLFGQKSEKRALELGMQLSLLGDMAVSYTHLTLPTNREV